MNSNTQNEFPLRQATLEDIPTLVSHHRRMFEEILKARNEPFTVSQLEAMEKAYTEKLQIHLANLKKYYPFLILIWQIKRK